MRKFFTVFFLSLCLTACASYRPSSDTDYEKAEKIAINNDKEVVQFHGIGGWHSDTSQVIVGRVVSRGNLVITDQAIRFMQWDEDNNSYDVVFAKKLSDIKSIKSYQFLGKWFVIKTDESRHDIFAFSLDSEKTMAAMNYIKQAIQKNANK